MIAIKRLFTRPLVNSPQRMATWRVQIKFSSQGKFTPQVFKASLKLKYMVNEKNPVFCLKTRMLDTTEWMEV